MAFRKSHCIVTSTSQHWEQCSAKVPLGIRSKDMGIIQNSIFFSLLGFKALLHSKLQRVLIPSQISTIRIHVHTLYIRTTSTTTSRLHNHNVFPHKNNTPPTHSRPIFYRLLFTKTLLRSSRPPKISYRSCQGWFEEGGPCRIRCRRRWDRQRRYALIHHSRSE